MMMMMMMMMNKSIPLSREKYSAFTGRKYTFKFYFFKSSQLFLPRQDFTTKDGYTVLKTYIYVQTLFQGVSPGYLTFSGPSNQLILLPAFTSTLAQRKTSLNCMHNTLFIDACLPGISYESERILADVHTLNIRCCYAKYYEGEENIFFYNMYMEKVNIDFLF